MTHTPHSSQRRLRALALAAAVCLAGSAALAQSSPARNNRSADFIVAVVNSELVTAVEVTQRVERAAADAKRAGGAAPNAAELRQQALDALIDERVQITYARENGARVDEAEVDRAVSNVAAQNQISVAELRNRLRAEGMDIARFRSTLRDQLMVERLRENGMEIVFSGLKKQVLDVMRSTGLFDLIVGSDILYERDDAGTLAQFIDEHAALSSEIWVIDPNRGNRAAFHKHMAHAGFAMHEKVLDQAAHNGAEAYKGRMLTYTRH
jgi:hypothetical protein